MTVSSQTESGTLPLRVSQPELRSSTITGSFLVHRGTSPKFAAGITSTAVLARILSPADFGLVGIVSAIAGFAGIFKDGGLSLPTIQRKDITDQQISNLFWCNVSLSLLISVVFIAAAPCIAWYYGDPRLAAVAAVSSLAFIAGGVANQHQALLRRSMNHTLLASIETVAVVVGHSVAIAIGLATKSYWSLVAIPLVQESVRTWSVWKYCDFRPERPRRNAKTLELVQFGGNFTAAAFSNYLARNADNLIIGKFFGLAAVGAYSRAYGLLLLPIQIVNGPIRGVAISTLSRLQDDPERYKRFYLNLVDVVNSVAIPLAVLCAVAGDLVINALLGPGWEASVPIIRWLSICALFQPIINSTSWLYISQSRGRDLRNVGILSAVFIVISFFVGVSWGVSGVAAAYSCCYVLVVVPMLYASVGQCGPVSTADLALATFRGLLHGAFVLLVLTSVRLLFNEDWPNLIQLAVCAFSTAFSVLFLTLTSRRKRQLVSSAVSDFKKP